MKVWKYEIDFYGDTFTQAMPEGAMFLSAQIQRGTTPVMWFLVDPHAPHSERSFIAVGTGQSVPADAMCLATLQYYGGDLVAHLFEVPA